MVGDVRSVLRELENVQDQLASLPKGTDAEKLALLARQEELRTKAARLAVDVDEHCSTQQLLAQLAELRRQRSALERQRLSSPGRTGPLRPGRFAEGGSATGPSRTPPPAAMPRVDERMRRIQQILAERGIDLR